MALTREERIEIQEAANFNYAKRLREQEEKNQLAERIQERMQEESRPRQTKPVDEVKDTDDTKKGK